MVKNETNWLFWDECGIIQNVTTQLFGRFNLVSWGLLFNNGLMINELVYGIC
jgi:hypothetical protein